LELRKINENLDEEEERRRERERERVRKREKRREDENRKDKLSFRMHFLLLKKNNKLTNHKTKKVYDSKDGSVLKLLKLKGNLKTKFFAYFSFCIFAFLF